MIVGSRKQLAVLHAVWRRSSRARRSQARIGGDEPCMTRSASGPTRVSGLEQEELIGGSGHRSEGVRIALLPPVKPRFGCTGRILINCSDPAPPPPVSAFVAPPGRSVFTDADDRVGHVLVIACTTSAGTRPPDQLIDTQSSRSDDDLLPGGQFIDDSPRGCPAGSTPRRDPKPATRTIRQRGTSPNRFRS